MSTSSFCLHRKESLKKSLHVGNDILVALLHHLDVLFPKRLCSLLGFLPRNNVLFPNCLCSLLLFLPRNNLLFPKFPGLSSPRPSLQQIQLWQPSLVGRVVSSVATGLASLGPSVAPGASSFLWPSVASLLAPFWPTPLVWPFGRFVFFLLEIIPFLDICWHSRYL